jgi:hypothetical protein
MAAVGAVNTTPETFYLQTPVLLPMPAFSGRNPRFGLHPWNTADANGVGRSTQILFF